MEYTTNSILSLISHLHTVSADFTNRRLSEKGDFVSSHGHILYQLSQKEKLTMGEISSGINRDKSTTTVLIRKLRETGLVREEASKEDARSKYISLTAKGRKYNELTSGISRELLEVCYRDFTAEEKQMLLFLLQKMNRNIEDSMDSGEKK